MTKTSVQARVAKHRLIKESARFKNEWLSGRDAVSVTEFIAAKTCEFESRHHVELKRFDPEWLARFELAVGSQGDGALIDVVSLLGAWKTSENPDEDRAGEAPTP